MDLSWNGGTCSAIIILWSDVIMFQSETHSSLNCHLTLSVLMGKSICPSWLVCVSSHILMSFNQHTVRADVLSMDTDITTKRPFTYSQSHNRTIPQFWWFIRRDFVIWCKHTNKQTNRGQLIIRRKYTVSILWRKIVLNRKYTIAASFLTFMFSHLNSDLLLVLLCLLSTDN